MTSQHETSVGENAEPIAIIGLACRVPGAADDAEFWRNLATGVESIEPSTLAEQAALGVPEHWLKDPYFVPVSAGLADVECLDAAFFEMSAVEAELRDPQHRLFLELAYTALEDSGYDPERYPGEIGVYGGSGEDAYQWLNTRRDPKAFAAAAPLGLAISSHTDYVATFTSFKLNLRGPSLTVHTACSTSLVAVHLACEALRNGECDIALGGAVNIDLPLGWGYMYFDGAIYSPDGHTRAFDAKAAGTMWSDGGGIVVLKRLADALADGDQVRAVILGNAINNDGRDKVGFTAPSQEGQATVIAQALGMAGVDPRTISYVEAHGTGTAIGDPIEVAALSSVYRRYCADAGWCGIGSVKTNIGHLGPAAGVAGVIKTVLAMEHGLVPPSLNFDTPNPKIDFAASPFYVSREPTPWESGQVPKRAGVSSFGVGGTNAHVVMEEAPATPRERGRPEARLIRLSARTGTALNTAAQRLAGRLTAKDSDHDLDVADVAYTLRTGRRELPHRLAVVATGPDDAAAALASSRRRITGSARPATPRVAFMFPGQGAQYPGMGSRLYRAEPVFRAAMDECAAMLAGTLDEDLREIMFAPDGEATLRQTAITQPALFTIEYALARLWQSWGVEPAAMVGHSIGEFVAATLAGVYSLPDALRVVAARGRFMQRMAPGAMLAVRMDEAALLARLPEKLAIAAVNGPSACVVSGAAEEVAGFARQLDHDGVGSRRLVTSHAFHSPMMEPALAEFRAVVGGVRLQPPRLGFLSNVTGEWMTATAATDPAYWTSQLVEPVRFGGCLATLLAKDGWLLLECGPGSQLCGLARLQPSAGQATAVPSLPGPADKRKDAEVLLAAVGQLWTAGVSLDEGRPGERHRRVSLPSYPWERKPYWIRPQSGAQLEAAPAPATDLPVDAWFAVPAWRQLPPLGAAASLDGPCLVFADPGRPSGALLGAVGGGDLVRVRPGEAFGRDPDGGYTIRPAERADYDTLIADLARTGLPSRIVHAWALDAPPEAGAPDAAWRTQDRTFFSLLNLVQAIAGEHDDQEVHLDILTAGACDVTGPDLVRPEHATVAGIVKVTPLELPWLSVRHIDTDPGQDLGAGSRAARQLSAELAGAADGSGQIALRAGRRWRLAYEQLPSIADVPGGPGLRDGGVYVITGGLGGIGITLAEYLATRIRARLVLVSRSGLPRDAGPAARRAVAAIRRMEDSGAEVLVLAEDVATADGARRVRDAAVERFSRVDGIVHAAGVPGGGMTEVKERSAAQQVMRPKLLGTLALRDAFSDLDLDFVVLCSSVTAIAGGFGQVDYCAANSFLDAHARSSAHAHSAPNHGWRAHVISANWGGWRDVGMAAEVTAPAAFRALQRGDRMTPVQHPVLTGIHEGSPAWCGGMVSASTHWILDEHRLAGVPVVPGTGFVEAARAAFAAMVPAPDPGHLIELRDMAFIEPMMVPDGTSAELRVVFSDGAEGFDFQLISLADGVTRTHVRGTAAWVAASPADGQDLDAIRQRCSLALRDGAQSHGSGLLAFGPRWSSARHTHVGHGEELTRIEANETVQAELGGWGLHPALLDEATATGWTEEGRRYLPLGYGSITARRPLTSRFWSHLRRHDTGATDIVTCDITLLDDSGRELVSIADFAMRQVDPQAVMAAVEAAPAGSQASAAFRGETMTGPGSATGIRPADGAEAFRLLLGADPGPQVVIAAQPVSELMAATRRVTHESVESDLVVSAAADRPGSREGHIAPRSELEAAIARLWSEVLGGEEVSVTDNFFEIGGNSLVAVQLIALIRREFGVRLPMRSLFEYPTVEGAAAKIAELRTVTP